MLVFNAALTASVYVRDDAGDVSRIILPVHGSGLWDLMYGFLAVDADGQTVRAYLLSAKRNARTRW